MKIGLATSIYFFLQKIKKAEGYYMVLSSLHDFDIGITFKTYINQLNLIGSKYLFLNFSLFYFLKLVKESVSIRLQLCMNNRWGSEVGELDLER